MSISETIYQVVKALPEDKANMVLRFAQFLDQQDAPNLSTKTPELPLSPTTRLVRKENVWVIATPPLKAEDDINEWINASREERIQNLLS